MNEMAQKPETVFRQQVEKFLKTLPNTWYESIQQSTIVGTPDILLCVNERFVAAEIKENDGQCTPIQKHKLASITKAGGMAFVVKPNNFSNFRRDLVRMAKKSTQRF